VTAPPVTADVAVVFGSGLAAIPDGALIERQIPLAAFGWPAPAVAGHGSILALARLGTSSHGAGRRDASRAFRLALVHGRPHLYEGWTASELERTVSDLAAWGVHRFLLLNACGGLTEDIAVGEVVVGTELVDLQAPPVDTPPRWPVCDPAAAARVAAALTPGMRARTGTYVAVPGPQYETSAEAAWLAGYGDVVGMSTAPEVRAARRADAELCLLSLVVNRAAEVGSHEQVLATAARFRAGLGAALEAVLAARWPECCGTGGRGAGPATPGPI